MKSFALILSIMWLLSCDTPTVEPLLIDSDSTLVSDTTLKIIAVDADTLYPGEQFSIMLNKRLTDVEGFQLFVHTTPIVIDSITDEVIHATVPEYSGSGGRIRLYQRDSLIAGEFRLVFMPDNRFLRKKSVIKVDMEMNFFIWAWTVQANGDSSLIAWNPLMCSIEFSDFKPVITNDSIRIDVPFDSTHRAFQCSLREDPVTKMISGTVFIRCDNAHFRDTATQTFAISFGPIPWEIQNRQYVIEGKGSHMETIIKQVAFETTEGHYPKTHVKSFLASSPDAGLRIAFQYE